MTNVEVIYFTSSLNSFSIIFQLSFDRVETEIIETSAIMCLHRGLDTWCIIVAGLKHISPLKIYSAPILSDLTDRSQTISSDFR